MKTFAAIALAAVLAAGAFIMTQTDDAGRRFLAETAETKAMFAALVMRQIRPDADAGGVLAYLDCVTFKLRLGWAFRTANDRCKARFAP